MGFTVISTNLKVSVYEVELRVKKNARTEIIENFPGGGDVPVWLKIIVVTVYI